MKIYLREKSIFQHCLVLISISSDIPYRYNILFIFFLFFLQFFENKLYFKSNQSQ